MIYPENALQSKEARRISFSFYKKLHNVIRAKAHTYREMHKVLSVGRFKKASSLSLYLSASERILVKYIVAQGLLSILYYWEYPYHL